jgi:hypothetical protein
MSAALIEIEPVFRKLMLPLSSTKVSGTRMRFGRRHRIPRKKNAGPILRRDTMIGS